MNYANIQSSNSGLLVIDSWLVVFLQQVICQLSDIYLSVLYWSNIVIVVIYNNEVISNNIVHRYVSIQAILISYPI
jgi:hypothetical protein